MSDVRANLTEIRERIDTARAAANRTDEVLLVAVSKTVAPDRIREAFEMGQTVFGENRVQEAIPKIEALPEARWHLIGHLQSNKAKRALEHFSFVESVDSVRLARKLDTEASSLDRTLPVLLEVNVAGEESKSGFTPESVRTHLPELTSLGHLQLRGIMTIAPLASDPEAIRWVFAAARRLRDDIRRTLPSFTELSMGMTEDFQVAISEGATMVRLGRAIFGDRPPLHARGQ